MTNVVDLRLEKILTSELEQSSVRQLKILCRKSTGEQLKIFDNDYIILCKHNSNVIGMCCIAKKSPEAHFENEKDREIPYLYNYICDKKHKKKKPSVAIMNFIKQDADEINLDVLTGNDIAIKFFEKNNFVRKGIYNQRIKSFIMYTFQKTL